MTFNDKLPRAYKGHHVRRREKAFILSNNEYEKAAKIMIKNGYKKLEINPLYYEPNSYEFLENFHFIEDFRVIYAKVDLDSINKFLSGVKSLDLDPGSNKYRGSLDFQLFNKLQIITLGKDIPGISDISKARSLESIKIYDSKLLELTLDLPHLENLSLINTKLRDLSGLEKLESLTSLQVINGRNIDELFSITHLPLKRLFISKCKNLSNSLSAISLIKSLRVLYLTEMGKIPSISFISSLFNLEYFNMSMSIVQDGDLGSLAHLYNNCRLKYARFNNKRAYSYKSSDFGEGSIDPELFLKKIYTEIGFIKYF